MAMAMEAWAVAERKDDESFLAQAFALRTSEPTPPAPILSAYEETADHDAMITNLLNRTLVKAPEPLKRPSSAMRAPTAERSRSGQLSLKRPSSAPPVRRPRSSGLGGGGRPRSGHFGFVEGERQRLYAPRRRSTPVVVSGLGARKEKRPNPLLHPTATVSGWIDPFAAASFAPRPGLLAAPVGTRPRYRATPDGRQRSPRSSPSNFSAASRPTSPVVEKFFGDLDCGVMGVSAAPQKRPWAPAPTSPTHHHQPNRPAFATTTCRPQSASGRRVVVTRDPPAAAPYHLAPEKILTVERPMSAFHFVQQYSQKAQLSPRPKR